MTEWWRRAQWALNATASTNHTMYSYGIGILGVLAKSDLAGSEEASLFDAVWEGSCTKCGTTRSGTSWSDSGTPAGQRRRVDR
jgi:hypothetical protein